MTGIAFPMHKPSAIRPSHSSACASPRPSDPRAVLVVYQPVFRHHARDASVPGTPGSPTLSPPVRSPSPRHARRSPPPSPSPLPAPPNEEEGHSVLDSEHSRPVDALQTVGQEVAEYLTGANLRSISSPDSAGSAAGRSSRSSRSASRPNMSIDCISILPASYIRSFHHAFAQRQKAAISRPPSPVDRSRRTSLLGGGRAHSPEHKVHHSDSVRSLRERAAHSRAGSIFASMIHASSGSSTAGEGSTAPSTRSGTEQLLELTDDLRLEDEASEETREQVLDRLIVLAGELEAGANAQAGLEMFVATDVQQAQDGETLAQAIIRLAHAKQYEEIVVVNDVDWAAEPASGRRNLHLPEDHDERAADHMDWLTPLPVSSGHTSPSSPLGSRPPSRGSERLGSGFPFPHTPHGSGSPSRRLSSISSHGDTGLPSLGRLFGHSNNHGHGHGLGSTDHHHFPSLSLSISAPHFRASRRERQDRAEVRRVLVTQTHRLARQLGSDMRGVQVTIF